MIKIKLKEHTQYGRKRYEPACLVSETIMLLVPKRTTFTSDDLVVMRAAGWEIEILEQSGWAAKRSGAEHV